MVLSVPFGTSLINMPVISGENWDSHLDITDFDVVVKALGLELASLPLAPHAEHVLLGQSPVFAFVLVVYSGAFEHLNQS